MADQLPSSASTAVSNVHPSRATNFAPATTKSQPKTPKEKTKAKKRYLAKKARRHKILAKAKKASAPKNKEWPTSDGDTPAVAEDSPAIGDATANAQAGPSRLPAPISTPAPVAEEEGSVQKDNKRKRKDEPDSAEALNAVDEASARERRKLEKREKRAARDHEEKRRRKEERAKARALKDQLAAGESALDKGKSKAQDDADADVVEPSDAQKVEDGESSDDGQAQEDSDEHASVDTDGDIDQVEGPDGRESPPPLMAFPLPTPAAAPDPALLSRQGLPENLAHATLIDQDLKVGIDNLEVPYPDGMQKGLGESMASHLKQMGVEELFAVQAAMLPHLLPLPLVPNPFEPLNDYLISAPTGSGKTLAYTIPIINILKQRQVVRLRALIVLPTRDLVVQVRETMEALAKGTGLVIGSATGQHSFSHEQNQLIADKETRLLGGSSKVDILIATPGRLIDHITQTPNFTLQHLRFLIIDEADRLLNQSFHNWLQQVLSHTRPPTKPVDLPTDFVWQPWDQIATEWQVAYGLIDTTSQWYRPPKSTCQKLLFSATLTRDPAAIASLNLRNPQYYIVQESTFLDTTTLGESFALPSTLSEKYLALPPQLKPLNLIHLLHSPEFAVKGGLVFTKSVESVNRLVLLLSYFEEEYRPSEKVVVKGYTSEMRPVERKNLLSGFAKGEIHLLVCSDVIARGVDLPTVEHVISYDTPVDIRKYVHRVGRTARAGRSGTAWTLVEKQEALHFKGMMRAAGREKKVKKVKVKEDDLASYREAYARALERVKDVYVRHD